MNKFFKQDKIIVGLVAGLGSMIAFCLLLAAVLMVIGIPLDAHPRWFGGMFAPIILILQQYARRREHLTVTKTLIVILFVTFIAFMIFVK